MRPGQPQTCPAAMRATGRVAASDGIPTWTSEDGNAGRGPSLVRHGGADDARRADQWRLVRSLFHFGAGARTQARRHRSHGQTVDPQADGDLRENRSGRRNPQVPSTLQPGLQSHRESVRTAQGHVAQGRRTSGVGPLGPHLKTRRNLRARRMRQLFQIVRI